MDTVKIDARDVNFWYGDFHALKGISMQIEEKSVVAFIGPSGCGKSTFLRYICEHTKKKHVVLAPTGIAAINAGGSTLHSFFKLPFYPLLPDDPNFSLQRGRIHLSLIHI